MALFAFFRFEVIFENNVYYDIQELIYIINKCRYIFQLLIYAGIFVCILFLKALNTQIAIRNVKYIIGIVFHVAPSNIFFLQIINIRKVK